MPEEDSHLPDQTRSQAHPSRGLVSPGLPNERSGNDSAAQSRIAALGFSHLKSRYQGRYRMVTLWQDSIRSNHSPQRHKYLQGPYLRAFSQADTSAAQHLLLGRSE